VWDKELPTSDVLCPFTPGTPSTAIVETQQLLYTVTSEGEFHVNVRADLVTAVRFTLVMVFLGMGRELRKVRQCKSCSAIFFARHQRQIFCSLRCKTRKNSERLRMRDRKAYNMRHRLFRQQRREKALAALQKKRKRRAVHA
jgi:hypothetical protein